MNANKESQNELNNLIKTENEQYINLFVEKHNGIIFPETIMNQWFFKKFIKYPTKIGHGTYGVVISPPLFSEKYETPIPIKIQDNVFIPKFSSCCNNFSLTDYVGKLFQLEEEANYEFEEASRIYKLCSDLTVPVYDKMIVDKYFQIIYGNGGKIIDTNTDIHPYFEKAFISFVNLFKSRLISNNFMHFDIKPDNILWNNENKKLVLIDFGLSGSFRDFAEFIENKQDLLKNNYMFWCPDFYIVRLITESIWDSIYSEDVIRNILVKCGKSLSKSLQRIYNIDYVFDINQEIVDYYVSKCDNIMKTIEYHELLSGKEKLPFLLYFYEYFLKGTIKTSDFFSLGLYYLIINGTFLHNGSLPLYVEKMITFNPQERLENLNNLDIFLSDGYNKNKFQKKEPFKTEIYVSKKLRKQLHESRIKELNRLL